MKFVISGIKCIQQIRYHFVNYDMWFKQKIFIFTAIFVMLILSIIVILWVSGYRYSPEYILIQKIRFGRMDQLPVKFWKHSGGYYPEDEIISFKYDQYSVNGDTFFINNQPRAQIIDLKRRFFMDYELTLKYYDADEYCYYASK